jgi:hypothetical protein
MLGVTALSPVQYLGSQQNTEQAEMLSGKECMPSATPVQQANMYHIKTPEYYVQVEFMGLCFVSFLYRG